MGRGKCKPLCTTTARPAAPKNKKKKRNRHFNGALPAAPPPPVTSPELNWVRQAKFQRVGLFVGLVDPMVGLGATQ